MVKKNKAVHGGVIPEQFALSSRRELQKGQLVRSKAGRDQGHYYLVLGREEEILYLVDGRKRGMQNPKKKNIRHVQKCNRVAADLIAKTKGRQPRDEELRAAINALRAKEEKEGEYV